MSVFQEENISFVWTQLYGKNYCVCVCVANELDYKFYSLPSSVPLDDFNVLEWISRFLLEKTDSNSIASVPSADAISLTVSPFDEIHLIYNYDWLNFFDYFCCCCCRISHSIFTHPKWESKKELNSELFSLLWSHSNCSDMWITCVCVCEYVRLIHMTLSTRFLFSCYFLRFQIIILFAHCDSLTNQTHTHTLTLILLLLLLLL